MVEMVEQVEPMRIQISFPLLAMVVSAFGCAGTNTTASSAPGPALSAQSAQSAQSVPGAFALDEAGQGESPQPSAATPGVATQFVNFSGIDAEPEATETLATQPRRPNMPSMLPSVITGPHGSLPASMMNVTDD